MKHLFTLLCYVIIPGLTAFGQAVQKIHKHDGSMHELPLSGIDSINFSGSPASALQLFQNDGSQQQVQISNIDSVTFTRVNDTLWGNHLLISIAGQVFDEAGLPLSGVSILAGDSQTTSDLNGVFYFSEAPVREKLAYITATKTGFFAGSRSFLPRPGTNTVKITLLRKNLAGTFAASSGGTIQSEGVSLVFAAGGFVKNGTPYSGQVSVALNYLNPESATFDSEMPGNLLGVSGATSSGLQSFGMMAVELNDNAGNPVRLASGATAELHFPLSSALQTNAQPQIDLWYFDETLGLWQHEGNATRVNNEYVAHVSHFTFWNCDRPFPLEIMMGKITDASGQPIAGAKVTVISAAQGSSSDYTSSTGHFGGNIPTGETLTLTVSVLCGGTNEYQLVHSASIGPFGAPTTLAPIQVQSPLIKPVTGRLTGCNNGIAKNGYVVAGGSAYFPDSTGVFNFVACGDSVKIQPFTASPMRFGTPIAISLTGNADAGTLEICSNGGETVTDIEGHVYSTVVIGTQEWMAENLRASKYADGSAISNITDSQQWTLLTTPAWCNYQNDANNDPVLGKLYNFYAVVDPRNLCPTGWHVPSEPEWQTLATFLGGVSVAGGKMKAASGWDQPNLGATNESGFSGLAAGFRPYLFNELGYSAHWWTSTEYAQMNTYGTKFNLTFNRTTVQIGGNQKFYGFSVRCVKN